MYDNFGISTWVWTSPFNTDSVSLFSKIKGMGYQVVEIPVEDPEVIDANEVKNALDEYGLGAVVCGAFGPGRDLTHEDSTVHQQCFNYLDALMEFCIAWGVDFVAGPMYSAVGKARLVSSEQKKKEWERAVTNLRKVSQRAEDKGLKLAIEPLNRFESDLVNTISDALQLAKDINHPAVKIMGDSFHMSIEEKNMEEAVQLADDELIHVQVSENYRGTPGTGQTRWGSLQKGLKAIDYQGVISIESFTSDNQELADAVCIWKPLADDQDKMAKDGLRFLKKTFIEN